jgi:triacylglycerol lipase
MNVVMAHGFLNSGRQFGPLQHRLESAGHACLAPTLHPRDGRRGIPDLAGKLAALIEAAVPAGAPLALVGFSMGALVARYYLQVLGGARRSKALFAIAGPFRGSLNAYLYPGAGTRQMRPGSKLLRELEATSGELSALAVYTYRTPFDLMIIPSTGGQIPAAKNVTIWCPLHALLPRDPRLIEQVTLELAALDPSAKPNVAPDWEPAI